MLYEMTFIFFDYLKRSKKIISAIFVWGYVWSMFSFSLCTLFIKIFHFPLSVFVGITGEVKSRAVSSVGRASRLHREGREFESLTAHQN